MEQAGRRLFAERGFAGTSAEELVTEAGVTRGALHHHYGDKRGLFVAVLEHVEMEIVEEVRSAIDTTDPDDLMAGMAVGLATFLEICQRPDVLRIVLTDAPAVLGWQAWREFENQHGLGLIADELERARAAGLIGDAPTQVLAQILMSAISEASLIVAHADDKDAARAQAQQSLLLLISGMVRTS